MGGVAGKDTARVRDPVYADPAPRVCASEAGT